MDGRMTQLNGGSILPAYTFAWYWMEHCAQAQGTPAQPGCSRLNVADLP